MMSNERGATPKQRNKLELAASTEELGVLDKLSEGLVATISDLVRHRPSFERGGTIAEVSINETRYATRKAYEELAKNCYGRTVLGEEIDENGRPVRSFAYRITQANVGYLDGGCNILARNSPVASKLVTASPGDESEINAPGGLRYLTAQQVRTFDGPTSLLSSTQRPNFRSMLLRLLGRKNPVVVQDIRAFVGSLRDSSPDVAASIELGIPKAVARDVGEPPEGGRVDDPTWLGRWQNVHLGSSETSSLSHQFFTRTTSRQENALNNPRGLTFVEGIAGSGKTSIALGRLKFFANFSTGEERAHYGLRNAPLNDFSPTNMVGFVLSHSLKRYLKETAAELGLEQLPIRDFQEFRSDLSNRFGLTKKFKRSQREVSPLRTKLAWALALDTAIAHAIGGRLSDFLKQSSELPALVQGVIARIAKELGNAQIGAERAFSLRGLAHRLIGSVMEAELRAHEQVINDRIQRETDRNIRYDLRNELERLSKETERNGISRLGRTLLSLIDVSDVVGLVAQSTGLEGLISRSFEGEADCDAAEISDAVVTFKSDMSVVEGNLRAITDVDLVSLLVLSAMIAEGFDRSDAPQQMYQIRRYTAAFIDEVQDFREIEVLLMGMVVSESYNQITLAGDRRQQLQQMGADDLRSLFPFVSRGFRNQPVFLDQNFRQRKELQILSAGVRSLLQEGRKSEPDPDNVRLPATVHVFSDVSAIQRFILDRLLTVDPYATVVFILPSEIEARRWYDLFHDELAAYHRPALLSHRDDLTRRNDIHFTDVREAKGLEFDVVVIPDISSFDLEDPIGRNQIYVAVSRPRYGLLLGCPADAIDREPLRLLQSNGFTRMVPLEEGQLR